jgi:hypothetical protein
MNLRKHRILFKTVNVVTHDFQLFTNAKWQTAASQSRKATVSAAVDSELSGRLSLSLWDMS